MSSKFPPQFFRVLAILLAIGLGVLGSSAVGITDEINNYIAELRFQAKERAPTGDIVLVDIDSRSLLEIGVWPWPRRLHGELVSEASKLGAARIAFDIDFSTSSSHVEDARFADALSAASAETFLAAFVQEGAAKSDSMLPSLPIDLLLRHSWPATVNVPVDRNGAVWRFPFSVNIGEEALASMPVVLANRSSSEGLFGIDFSLRAADLPRVSYIDIINNRVSREALSGKTLIVGATALELRDLFSVPVHGIVSGSTIIALATETLLQDRELAFVAVPPFVMLCIDLLALSGFMLVRSWRVIFGLLSTATAVEALAFYLQVEGNTVLGTASVHILLAEFAIWALAREFDLRRLLLWTARTETGNSEHMLDRVVEDGFDGVIILNDQDLIVRVSQLGLNLLGLDHAGRLEDLPAALAANVRAARRLFKAGDVVSRAPRQLELGAAGHGRHILEYTLVPFWLKKITAVDRNVADDAAFICLTLRDVTERQIAQERLQFMAHHDSLTGLHNRRALEERLDELLIGSQALDPTALLSFDLDRFKSVNDALGHPIGDKVLIEVAQRAMQVFVSNAILARVGGDEYSALLVGAAAADARKMANSLVSAISEPFLIQDHRICVGASVGIVQWAGTGKTASAAMRQADVALYRAKHSGTHIVLFDPLMEEDRLARLELERELEAAFDSDQFEIVYQPQISLSSESYVGAEALLRWKHPAKGYISPVVFIPVAEEMGLIHRLGSWALTTACRDAVRWPMPIKVAVNVSSLQFETGDLVGAVRTALQSSSLPAARLELEITESAFVQESDRLKSIFDELLSLGVSFALDDFGTGYSSLGYLHRFPISKIKIDRSFVTGLPKDSHSMAILRSVRALADGLDIRTIGEGVETPEQAEVLRLMGCDDGQGYLYSRPVDANSLRNLMTRDESVLQRAS